MPLLLLPSSDAGGGMAESGTTVTTSQADEVCVAFLVDASTGDWLAPNNSFTEVIESASTTYGSVLEERIVSATGAYSTSASHLIPLVTWKGVIATFKMESDSSEVTDRSTKRRFKEKNRAR